ncbi:MAG TPA: S41 family peptidase [Spirochaetota bacterium]|nr:S41 family peptidase [Spirochaetota bacterium]HOM38916.1 S41 family peptidase [Spirochaetota bacterium]HPQ49105.1 S41 family peptidase [Spirochaetota bacterium]
MRIKNLIKKIINTIHDNRKNIIITTGIIIVFYIVTPTLSFKKENDYEYYSNLLRTALKYLNDYYVDSDNVSLKDLYYGAIKGMMEATKDPYTTLLEPKILKSLMESISGEFEGIGAYIGIKDNRIVVISPIEGTPAYRAGIRPGDIIMKINEKDTEGMKVEDAVSLLRGPEGSKVTIKVYRKGYKEFLTFTITRQKIDIPSVKGKIIENDIGYIKINSFAENTPDELSRILENFESKSIRKIIIDLRNNPGGSLMSVVNIADFFLPAGLVVYTQGRQKEDKKEFYSEDGTLISEKSKIALLVNGGSASASEILTGALKDRKRAIVIGEKTFGKGSVQNVLRIFNDLDKEELGLKITTAKYYTPAGYEINNKGIEPDIKVELPKMSPKEEIDAIKIIEDKHIEKFVEKNKDTIPDSEFNKLKNELSKNGINIRDIFLKKLIRDEQNLYKQDFIDLEFDTQLKKAIEVLNR